MNCLILSVVKNPVLWMSGIILFMVHFYLFIYFHFNFIFTFIFICIFIFVYLLLIVCWPSCLSLLSLFVIFVYLWRYRCWGGTELKMF